MANEIGMDAQMKELARLLVALATRRYTQGQTDGGVSGATKGCLRL